MQPSDGSAFHALLRGVHEFYRQPFTDFTADVWWEAMRPYEFEAVRVALNRHAVDPDHGQFLPKPADVVRLLDGGNQDAALRAWTAVDRAVRTVGPYQSLVFDDPLVHSVVADMGGWPQLCASTDEQWPFVRNEFVTRYRGARLTSGGEHPRLLTGIAQQVNALAGQPIAPPLAIGNVDRARQVYRIGRDGKHGAPVPLTDLMRDALPALGDERKEAA